MAEISVGIDVVEVSRFRRFHEASDESQLATLFTPNELAAVGSRANRVPGLASRFAAKEAVVKALGNVAGFSMDWRDVEIVTEAGVPRVELHGQVAEAALDRCVGSVKVSLSHTRTTAIAQALAIRDPSRIPAPVVDGSPAART